MDKTMLDILKERLVEGLSIKSVKETNAKYTIHFEFEGDDIIYLCRTAMNGAHSFHDSNYSTFHRVEDFRKL